MAKIGFVGASGLIRQGMAKHLQLKGHSLALTVHGKKFVLSLVEAQEQLSGARLLPR